MSPSHPRRLAGLAVVATVLLSGCGGAQPGVAALVGDDTITLEEVDSESALLCQAVEEDLESPLPMRLARFQVLQGQISRSIADQIGEEYAVTVGDDYAAAVASSRVQFTSYPEETQETLVYVSTTSTYVESVVGEAARADLEAEGLADPTLDQVTARSTELFATWPDSHDLKIDPRFGFDLVDGEFVNVETGVSMAVSETATNGRADEPDPAVTAGLPAAQRCG